MLLQSKKIIAPVVDLKGQMPISAARIVTSAYALKASGRLYAPTASSSPAQS
jgi:hypothetical protein